MATAVRRENSKAVCRFFGTAKGCWFGDNCRYSHDRSNAVNIPICRFFNKGGCRFGNMCKFRHPGMFQPHLKSHGLEQDCNNNVQNKPKPKPIFLNEYRRGANITERRRKIHAGWSSSNEDEFDTPSPLKKLSSSPDEDAKTKAKNPATGMMSVRTESNKDSDNKGNSEEKPSEGKPTHIHCGFCDVKHENTDDGRESLAAHHKTMLFSKDSAHIILFGHHFWGEKQCHCILCDSQMGSPIDFLMHLKKNWDEDEVFDNRIQHHHILKNIIEDLIMGDEEGDSDAFLIENLKDWFGLETEFGWPFFFGIDEYVSCDNQGPKSAPKFETRDVDERKLRFMMNRLGLYEEDSDDDSDDDGGMFGMTGDEVDELMCQGIKPWDPEAMAALEVLYDY